MVQIINNASIKIGKKVQKKHMNLLVQFVKVLINSTTINNFQKLKEKDLIVMCDVGAYGMSLSSNYNVRPKPIEILIKGSKIKVIKKRQKLKDLI